MRRDHPLLQPAPLPAPARGGGDEHALAGVIACADERLGKTVVLCRDAPGFIANRLGAMWIDVALAEAVARGLDVELADAAVARAFRSPKTGVFGLLDLVGIDLSLDVTRSLAARLRPDDPLQAVDRPLAAARAPRRGRPHRSQGRRRLLPARARPHEARARPRVGQLPAGAPVRGDEPAGAAYAAVVRDRTLAYAEVHPRRGGRRPGRRRPRDGDRLRLAGRAVRDARPAPPPRRRPGVGTLARREARAASRRAATAPRRCGSIGDGVLCLEFHTKMNAIDTGHHGLAAEAIATRADPRS